MIDDILWWSGVMFWVSVSVSALWVAMETRRANRKEKRMSKSMPDNYWKPRAVETPVSPDMAELIRATVKQREAYLHEQMTRSMYADDPFTRMLKRDRPPPTLWQRIAGRLRLPEIRRRAENVWLALKGGDIYDPDY